MLWLHSHLSSCLHLIATVRNLLPENCDVDVVIDHAGYQSKKQQGKNYSSRFLRSFYLVSLTFGYLWRSSSQRQQRKRKRYSRGIAGITDQQTAFTRLQGAILLSRDFNLRVERAQKIPYPRS